MSQDKTAYIRPPKRIGMPMAKADWREAIRLLNASSPEKNGRVFLPKNKGEYGGWLILVTETHLVQRVERDTAVAHDLDKLIGGVQLAADFDAGKIPLGQRLRVQYGTEADMASIVLISPDKQMTWMRMALTEWAQRNITNPRGRGIFLEHLETAIDVMAFEQEHRVGRNSTLAKAPLTRTLSSSDRYAKAPTQR